MNSRNWSARVGERDDSIQTPDAVDVSNSILAISSYTDPATGKHYTGFLDTNTSPGCKFIFGYIEARIRFENRPGQWSAFWLQSSKNGVRTPPDPTAGVEIDIIEHRAVVANNRVDVSNQHSSAVHWNGYGPERRSVGSGVKTLPAGESFSDWHTVGLLWTRDKYQFYLDATQYWETTEGISTSDEFIGLTTEVKDKDWAGDIPPGGYGARGASSNPVMQVDWVRAWQLPSTP